MKINSSSRYVRSKGRAEVPNWVLQQGRELIEKSASSFAAHAAGDG